MEKKWNHYVLTYSTSEPDAQLSSHPLHSLDYYYYYPYISSSSSSSTFPFPHFNSPHSLLPSVSSFLQNIAPKSKHVPDFRVYDVGDPAELKKKSISFGFLPLSIVFPLFLSDTHSYISFLLSRCIFALYHIYITVMNGYEHITMSYLPPNTNTTTDDYMTPLPALGLAEQSFQTPTYSNDHFRRYDVHLNPYVVRHADRSRHH